MHTLNHRRATTLTLNPTLLVLGACLLSVACGKKAAPAPTATTAPAASKSGSSPTQAIVTAQDQAPTAAPGQPAPDGPGGQAAAAATELDQHPARMKKAKLGAPAPDFALPGVDGKLRKLSSFRGKVVVLEWFNPDCPFVRWAHEEGPLKDMARRYSARGVQWIAVNSSAPGKQGYGQERNRVARETFQLDHPILLDEDGYVGIAYGATNTPQLYVIDKAGVLVYRGALDNLPFGELTGGDKPRKHCEEALADVMTGAAVRVAKTRPWGCTVKYK